MINQDFSIVHDYQTKLRGLYQYYALATNVSQLHNLKWIMEQSLMKTLAAKHKCSVRVMLGKYKTSVKTEKHPSHGEQRRQKAIGGNVWGLLDGTKAVHDGV